MSYRAGKPHAARAVWPGVGLKRAPAPAWVHAATRAAFAAVLAATLAFFGHKASAGLVSLIALLTVALASVAPDTYQRLQRVLDTLSVWVGRLAAYALLTPTFYLLITPLGLLRRKARKRFAAGQVTSRWQPREKSSSVAAPY